MRKKAKTGKALSEYNSLPVVESGLWGGCDRCPISDHCEKTTRFNAEQLKKGCGELKSLMQENLKMYSAPERMVVVSLAEIRTRQNLEQMRNGLGVNSKEFKMLKELELKFLNMVMKYGKGTVHTQIQVSKTEDEFVIPVSADSYEDVDEKKGNEGKEVGEEVEPVGGKDGFGAGESASDSKAGGRGEEEGKDKKESRK